MQQFFIAIILVLGLSSWYLYNENQTLKGNVIKIEQDLEDQRVAFETMKEQYEKQGQELNNLARANAQIEAEKDQYLAIFRKHNLDKLALMKLVLLRTE